MTEEFLGFVHRFVPAQTSDAPTLLLLHGTGGDENDLLPVGRMLAEGVFDHEDLMDRTHELAGFVDRAVDEYDIDQRRLFAVGFSNGANVAASLLLTYPRLLAGAILLRAMVPFEPDKTPDLSRIPVYLAAGRSDQMVPPENTERLAQVLREAGADVTLDWQPGGHGIGPTEIQAARNWFADRIFG